MLIRLASNKSTKVTHQVGYSYGVPTDMSEDLEELDLDAASIAGGNIRGHILFVKECGWVFKSCTSNYHMNHPFDS